MADTNLSPPAPAAAPDRDAEKERALKRIKRAATLTLLMCIALFVGARLLEPHAPGLVWLAAFAEAAAIGGIADWYAVVALFRRPLGLPIPHTAIIPANQTRIADNLGGFIEANFLAPAPVRAKLGAVDFAAHVADWLADRGRADGLARFMTRMVPQTLDALEESGLPRFLARRARERIEAVEFAPLAAGLLSAFVADRRHQKLFDELITALGRFLNDEAALAALRDKIRAELPTLARYFRADAYLLHKIVAAAGTLLDEVRADPDHKLRHEFDRFAADFVAQLATSPAYAAQAERLKREVLARPELRSLAADLWAGLRRFLLADAGADDSATRRHLTRLLTDIGRQLAQDDAIRADMNQGFVTMLAGFVETQKSGVSAFIADQVKRWDLAQLTRLVELNIGRDLQYIRFNGMIVGGLAGLLLHLGEVLVFGN